MIRAAIHKELRLLVRDRGTLISLFALPVVFTLAFGAMFGRVALPPGAAGGNPALRALGSVSGFQVAVPGNAVLFGFFLSLTVAMALVTEGRTGTWLRLLAAPVARGRVLLAMLVPYAVIGAIQLGFLFAVGVVVFGLEVAGSVPALVALSAAVVCCAVALGLLLAAVGGGERQIGGVGAVALLVMGMLGGAMVPRIAMPSFMQTLGLGVPHGWALDGYHDLLVVPGTSFAEIAPSLVAVIGFAITFAGLGLWRFRFER